MIRIAICDDEVETLKYVSNMLKSLLSKEHKIFQFEKASKLQEYLEDDAHGVIDILLVDIALGRQNGIELSKQIKARFPTMKIIFITGHVIYSQDIFETEPTYFLLKPISKEKLFQAIQKALHSMGADKKETLTIQTKGSIMQMPFSQIAFIESTKRMIALHAIDGEYEIYGKLDEWENKLPKNFLRCHKSFLVNMDIVKYLNPYYFLLYSGKEIPVSQLKYKETKQKFLKYIGDSI